MKKRLALYTTSNILLQKIRLLLRHGYDVQMLQDGASAAGYGYILVDTATSVTEHTGAIYLGRGRLSYPLSHSELIDTLERTDSNGSEKRLTLSLEDRCAYLGDECIRLTELETRLLAELIAANGGFVSRDTLMRRIWPDTENGGVVNVYIHYLREKLELHGEKIIISSRKEGYRIDKKYGRGE